MIVCHTNEERASINIQSNCLFYRCIIYEKIEDRLIVGGLVESREMFELFYSYQERGTVISSKCSVGIV